MRKSLQSIDPLGQRQTESRQEQNEEIPQVFAHWQLHVGGSVQKGQEPERVSRKTGCEMG